MADKLSDVELAEEFLRFGEEIKLPIDRKRRPILIKKLNHYRAKENPPVKRGKSASRRSQPVSAPAEFSDDSQEDLENETTTPLRANRRSGVASASGSATVTPNNTSRRSSRGKKENIDSNGANVKLYSHRIRADTRKQGAHQSPMKQLELYPSEFSDADNDTADESVYEVENKSINTSLPVDISNIEDDEEEEEECVEIRMRPRNYTPRKHGSGWRNKKVTVNSNHIDYEDKVKMQAFKTKEENTDFKLKDHLISKTIVTVLAIFFLGLAVSYACVRFDLYAAKESTIQTGTRESKLCARDGQNCLEVTSDETTKCLGVLRVLQNKLAILKGQYEMGQISLEESQYTIHQLETDVNPPSQTKLGTKDVEKAVNVSLRLILLNPGWDIRALDSKLEVATLIEDVVLLEAVHADLPFVTRVWFALRRVLYGLCLLLCCLFAGVIGIYLLRWKNKRNEREQKKVFDMVEKIIEILKENSELAESKQEPENYPSYLAVQHIRDQLIPVAQRRKMQSLWEEAVKFIEANESRIRVETQTIQGEEFTVWRWLQTLPNGGRIWQGQAFGETSHGSINTLPYGPTPCLKIRNMFDSNSEQKHGHVDWHVDIQDAILEKCSPNHGILHVFVDKGSREGCVYIKCSSCEKAYETYSALHGWWFDGRLVTVKYLRLEHYHDRFPDSRNSHHPLKPTSNSRNSVSRPYHKSVLEMT